MSDRSLSFLGFLLIGVITGSTASAQGTISLPVHANSAGSVQQAVPKPLATVLREIEVPSGIRFQLAPGLEHDPVTVEWMGTGWSEVVGNLLSAYNYLGTGDAAGRLRNVSITGRKGDGSEPNPPAAVSTTPDLLSYRGNSGPVPKRYRAYAPGSVYPIEIPVERLRRMPKGSRVSVNLPDGRYQFIHDHAWHHGNGDDTWVGYVEGTDGGPYRALLTLGENGVEGDIRTPGGVYQLESEGTLGWLIDMNASGLQPASLEADQHFPAAGMAGIETMATSAMTAGIGKRTDTASAQKAAADPAATVTDIDVAMLYSGGLASSRINTQLRHLITLANQAMLDSGVNVRLRLVATRQTAYPDGGSNDAALENLTTFRKAFRNVARLRRKTGADMVLAIRPFKLASQGGNCGEAWVNGAGGTELIPELAFGVISYGSSGGYYCPRYTLAHEAGHILGAVHDRAHANFTGAFSFSYGYGVPGLFGDIMSYIDPQIGLYANPDIQCAGQSCGIAPGRADSADVAETFNRTAASVAGFMSTVVVP